MAKPFDKLFKEIIERVAPFLAENLQHLRWEKTEDLKDKTQQTQEREADYLKLVVYKNHAGDYIYHAEFHVKIEDIRNWMLFQRSLMRYKYNLPVRQVVFFLGDDDDPNLPCEIDEQDLWHRFEVVVLKKVPYQIFMESDVPEVALLSILASYPKEEAELVIKEILIKFQSHAQTSGELNRLVNQLEIFSHLRKLQPLTEKIIETMPITYDLETDNRYRQGIQRGEELGIEKGEKLGIEKGEKLGIEKGEKLGIEKGYFEHARTAVTKMLESKRFTVEEIAEYQQVSLEFVLIIKKQLEEKAQKK